MTVVALIVYGVFAAVLIAAHGVNSLPNVGRATVARSTASRTIDMHLHPRGPGYDGQFFLIIALDPVKARTYLDTPDYRYSHILYPILARAVALGKPGWVPAALILVNLAAVALGTFCVAKLLVRNGLPPGLAALYFLFPGLLSAFAEDLSEPLAYGLAALALLLLAGWRSPNRIFGAAAVFALAALTRETTLLIAVTAAGVHALASPRQTRRAIEFTTIVLAPYLAWRVFLRSWLGSATGHPGLSVGLVPFSGLASAHALDIWPVLGVAVPATALGLICLLRLRVEWRNETFVALLASLVVLALYLPAQSYRAYESAGRLQIGAALLAVVTAGALKTRRRDPLLLVAVLFAYLPLVPLVVTLFRTGYT